MNGFERYMVLMIFAIVFGFGCLIYYSEEQNYICQADSKPQFEENLVACTLVGNRGCIESSLKAVGCVSEFRRELDNGIIVWEHGK